MVKKLQKKKKSFLHRNTFLRCYTQTHEYLGGNHYTYWGDLV